MPVTDDRPAVDEYDQRSFVLSPDALETGAGSLNTEVRGENLMFRRHRRLPLGAWRERIIPIDQDIWHSLVAKGGSRE